VRRALGLALVAVLGFAPLAGCAGASHGPHAAKAPRAPAVASVPPAPDSVTLALWHFDEDGGTRAADAGPFRLDGIAGIDTHTDFGRYRTARVFQRTNDSFVYVGYNPALEAPGSFTVEAWVNINTVTPYEMQVIAGRWTPVPNTQGWVLGISGNRYHYPLVPVESPGWFLPLVGLAPAQHLVFGFTPATAGDVKGYASNTDLPMGRWVHVAATLDGQTVRLYIDGRLDAQFASHDTIRPTQAPLMVGNAFDPRYLTSFGGDLRIDTQANVTMFYQFDGAVDELRLSSAARSRFESAPVR
jgi:Concanavalin A-like lectin/glucanases superfamily